MSALQPLIERNKAFAGNAHQPRPSAMPNHPVVVVTCMDPRVDPAHLFAMEQGDAIVVRNTAGRVTDDVIEEVVLIDTLVDLLVGEDAPSFEVAIVHHTGCGSALFSDPAFRAGYAARIGVDEDYVLAKAVTDPAQTVAADVDKLQRSPLLPARAMVSGHVYDVDTGLITTVVPT